MILSSYVQILQELSKEYGGWVNAHTHLDRANTLDPKYWRGASVNPFEAATYSLTTKQNLTGELHKGLAYTKEDLEQRIMEELRKMRKCGVKSVTSLIDATPDIGMVAIDAAIAVRKRMKGKMDFKIGTQPIFGFKYPDRWELFVEASKRADVIGGLPEKDDGPGRIGYDEHLRRVIQLGIELGKEVHIHVDQGNDPRERGMRNLIEAVRWLGSPKVEGSQEPTVWAVHEISSSCLDEKSFKEILELQKKYNIGYIGCARAAISMCQLRPLMAPIHNCTARILEMVKY